MPVENKSKINISVLNEEKEILITGKIVLDFFNKTKMSVFSPMEWLDETDIVFTFLDICGVDSEIMLYEEIANAKAEILIMAANVDDAIQKKIMPIMERNQQKLMQNAENQAEMLNALLNNSPTLNVSE